MLICHLYYHERIYEDFIKRLIGLHSFSIDTISFFQMSSENKVERKSFALRQELMRNETEYVLINRKHGGIIVYDLLSKRIARANFLSIKVVKPNNCCAPSLCCLTVIVMI